jgi:hypothetical protein
MNKQDLKAWLMAIAVLGIAVIIGNFFGIELEKTIW